VIVSLFIAARIEAATTDENRSDSVGVAAVLERRTLLRLPIYRPAMIHFAGIRGVHPCVVENMHFQGASISAGPYYIFANVYLAADAGAAVINGYF
jgi:hypothetical protein